MKIFALAILSFLFFVSCAPANDSIIPPTLDENLPQETALPEDEPSKTPISPSPIAEMPIPSKATSTNTSEPKNEESAPPSNDVNDPIIEYHRTGGYAGVDEKWLIYADGRIDGPSKRVVAPKEVDLLLETILDAGFFEMDDSYIPKDTCCDRFTHSITVQVDGKTKTVTTIDLSPTQPENLSVVLVAINNMMHATE